MPKIHIFFVLPYVFDYCYFMFVAAISWHLHACPKGHNSEMLCIPWRGLIPCMNFGRFTNRQLLHNVDAFANGLYEVPFKHPATMVIWGKDCAETLVAQLGAIKAGVKVISRSELLVFFFPLSRILKSCKWNYGKLKFLSAGDLLG